jgi:hypothetical protein
MIVIATSCVEDLNKSRYYTDKCIEFVKKWSKHFKVYVNTNNVELFKTLDCTPIKTDKKVVTINDISNLDKIKRNLIFKNYDKYWTFHDKVDIIDVVFKDFNNCIWIDCDKYLNDDVLNLLHKFDNTEINFEGGFIVSNFVDKNEENYKKINNYEYPQWGYLKNFDYFFHFNDKFDNILNNDIIPMVDGFFFIKKFKKWNDFNKLILQKYKKEAIYNDLKFYEWEDRFPHYPIGRMEGISFVLAANELNIPMFRNNLHFNSALNSIYSQ